MSRRLTFILLTTLAALGLRAAGMDPAAKAWKVRALAQDYVVVASSSDPQHLFLGSPSILALGDRRLIASYDYFGPGVASLPGPKGLRPHFATGYNALQTVTLTSDDHGQHWTPHARLPFTHARLFADGPALYLLGNCGKLMISRSLDRGDTWSDPVALTDDDAWAMGATNVLAAHGNLYAPMMYRTDLGYKGYFISTLAPVLLRAKQGANLLDPHAWAQSEPRLAFRDVVDESKLDSFGIPFFPLPNRNAGTHLTDHPPITAEHIGWHEPYVVQITDPTSEFYDPTGRTFVIVARGDVHRPNYAMLSKVTEDDQGRMHFGMLRTPAGTSMVFAPMPGGNIKFALLQDPATGLYWLASNQITDSLRRPDALPEGRFGLPLDQRERLVLHYSRNLVDWVFAGLIAIGQSPRESFHYCGMDIDGDDLVVLSRSGSNRVREPDAPYRDAHNTDMITFHRIADFRRLTY